MFVGVFVGVMGAFVGVLVGIIGVFVGVLVVNALVGVRVSAVVGVKLVGIGVGLGKSDRSRRRLKTSSNTKFASISLSRF